MQNKKTLIFFELDAPEKLTRRMDLVIHRLRQCKTQADLEKTLERADDLWQQLKQHPNYRAVRPIIEAFTVAIMGAKRRIAAKNGENPH